MLFFWFFKNCELIKDSSLWRSNFIPSIHDSIIIIGLRSVTYTFGSRFTYKRWVRVLSKFEFKLSWAIIPILFVGSQSVLIEVRIIIPILFVGSQSVSIEVRIIWYQSTGSKTSFLSLYLLFPVIIKKKRLQKRNRKQKKILFVVSILSNQNIIFFCPLPLI